MKYALLVIAAWLTLGALLTIHEIGKPRKPLTSAVAVLTVVVVAAETIILVIAAGRLS